MEELNKTQVVLLTLFITFVTSVTTGIVTVTLLQQAPPGITQTINRVVERTIEKVTPIMRTETKIVVAQEDQIINTVALTKPSVVRIVLPVTVAEETVATTSNQASVIVAFEGEKANELGTGIMISTDGLVATAYSLIPDQSITYDVYVGDKKYSANVVIYNKTEDLAILKIEHEKTVKFYVPPFATRPVTLGQTIIVLGRDLTRYTVSVGLVSSLRDPSLSALPSFKTTVRSDETNIGGPLLTSDGALIGLNLEAGNALPVELLKSYLGATASTTKPSI